MFWTRQLRQSRVVAPTRPITTDKQSAEWGAMRTRAATDITHAAASLVDGADHEVAFDLTAPAPGGCPPDK